MADVYRVDAQASPARHEIGVGRSTNG